MEVKIPDQRLEYLNPAARVTLAGKTSQYAEDVLQEAGRLESAQHSAAGNPEITSTMISDADTYIRRAYVRRRESGLDIWLRVGSYAAAIAASVAGTELDNTLGQAVFVLSVIIGIVCLAVLEVRKR